MKLKRLASIAAGLGAVLQLQAQGYIVPNGVTSVDIGGVNEIRVLQNPTNLDYTGFVLLPSGGSLFSFHSLLDEGVRVFLVSSNQPVALQPILALSYVELLSSGTYSFADGDPFYVGLYTGYTPQGGIYNNPMFGWAQLVNGGGTIQLLGGAVAYNAGGIYAGTQILVPEPSALSLFGLGALLLGWHLRRHSRP